MRNYYCVVMFSVLLGLMLRIGSLNCNDLVYSALFSNSNIHYFGSLIMFGGLFGVVLSFVLSHFVSEFVFHMFIACWFGIVGCVCHCIISLLNYNAHIRYLLILGQFFNGIFCGFFMTSLVCFLLHGKHQYKSHFLGAHLNCGIFLGTFIASYVTEFVDLYKFSVCPFALMTILTLTTGFFCIMNIVDHGLPLIKTEIRKTWYDDYQKTSVYLRFCNIDKKSWSTILALFSIQQMLGFGSMVTYFDLILKDMADLTFDTKTYVYMFSILGIVGSLFSAVRSSKGSDIASHLRRGSLLMTFIHVTITFLSQVLRDDLKWICCALFTALMLVYSATWLTLPWTYLANKYKSQEHCSSAIFLASVVYWCCGWISMELFTFISDYSLNIALLHLAAINVAAYVTMKKVELK